MIINIIEIRCDNCHVKKHRKFKNKEEAMRHALLWKKGSTWIREKDTHFCSETCYQKYKRKE